MVSIPEWWGCFDGIYRKLKENGEKCEVYNLSGEEGKLPADIVVSDYRKIDWKRCWKEMYIHNPYDIAGIADAAGASFCYANLKEHAQTLIYVPHFMGGVPEEYKQSTVYTYADRIYLSGRNAEYSLDIKYADKIVKCESGIPKYMEKLHQTIALQKSEKRVLWMEVSYLDIYYDTEKFLRKWEQVLDYLGTRQDISLILHTDEDILERMQRELPEALIREYQRILGKYRNVGYGIWEEGKDFYEAAVRADGYIGTGRNWQQNFFRVQGKLRLIIDMEYRPLPTEDDICVPSFWSCEIIDDEAWFLPGMTNYLCKKKLTEESDTPVEIVAEIPEEKDGWLNFIGLKRVGDKLYLLPYNADGIWIYDLAEGTFEKIYLENGALTNVTFAEQWEKYLYLFPRSYEGIIKLDTETGSITVQRDWIMELNALCAEKDLMEPYFVWSIKREEDSVHLLSSRGNVYMCYELGTDKWEMKKLGESNGKSCAMEKQGYIIWSVPSHGEDVVKYNLGQDTEEILCHIPAKETTNIPFASLLDIGDVLYALPLQENQILQIDKKTDAVTVYRGKLPYREVDFQSEYLRQRKTGYQLAQKLSDGKFLLYQQYDGAFLVVDKNLAVCKRIPCRMPYEAMKQRYRAMFEHTFARGGYYGNVHESYSLPVMIDYFVAHAFDNQEKIKECYWSLTKEFPVSIR